jgi:hypothetical protein
MIALCREHGLSRRRAIRKALADLTADIQTAPEDIGTRQTPESNAESCASGTRGRHCRRALPALSS